ncbi:hypothetical protein BG006_007263, partial [Podila minutissima]
MFNAPMLLDFNSNSKRSKITKACDNCRRRRVKCDGVPDGCGGCKAAKTQCVYTTSNTKRGPPKGYVEVIEDRLGKIENMLAGIVKKKKNIVPAPDTDRATAQSDIDHDNDNDDDDASIYSTELVEVKTQPPASPALRPARSSTPTNRNIRSGSVTVSPLGRHSPLISRNRSLTSLLPFSQESSAPPQDQVHSDMVALTNMFSNLGTTSVRTTVPFPWLTPEQSRVYGRNYLQFTLQSLEPPLPALARSFAPTLPHNVTLDLIIAYFDNINPFLPIIHKAAFMKQWQREACQLCPSLLPTSPNRTLTKLQHQQEAEAHKGHLQDPVPPMSPLLLNALLAVAAKATDPSMQSQTFFDAARLLLDEFLDVPRVSTVQALCLMSQFHHQGQWKATRSSTYLSMAIRMAHELGLNRDPEMTDIANGPEADSLRYLWWSMFVLDHQFSSWQGLGLLMHGKESDVEFPVDYDSTQQNLRGFVSMARLVKLLGDVLQHSYSTRSLPAQFGGHDSVVSYIEGALTSWLGNLTPELRWQHPSGARRGSPASPRSPQVMSVALARECGEIYPAYLYIVYNTTLILLHRPYIVGAAGSPAAAQSNAICTGSGRAITDIAQGLDMAHCSYIVNRFALYALLQAGVIHAMNAVYDKRGSEVAMEYYRRTLRVLEGFMSCAAYSGGVTEGIKILEQFLFTTSKAAAEDGKNAVEEPVQVQDGPARKKRQFEAAPISLEAPVMVASPAFAHPMHPPQGFVHPSHATMTPSTLSMMTSASDLVNPIQYDYRQAQGQSQAQAMGQSQVPMDLKEQQKQQQLKIQQQHRMYQQMQTFGATVKLENKNDVNPSELQKLEQQQLQQQQLLRHQLQ